MQQVFTLRKIILIFGITLAVFGCAMNKEVSEKVVAVQYEYSANGELDSYTVYLY